MTKKRRRGTRLSCRDDLSSDEELVDDGYLVEIDLQPSRIWRKYSPEIADT